MANSFLSSVGDSYVNTHPEYSLELLPARFGYRLIGCTQDGLDVRAVPGNGRYVMLTGFMFPAIIFREESAPPVDLATLPVEEIVVVINRGTEREEKSSRDAQLIAEATRSMQSTPIPIPTNSQTNFLRLYSPDLPGLDVARYVRIDTAGAVYFAPMHDDQHGQPAGPLFTDWISK